MTNITLFSQIITKLDRTKFKKIVKDKQTDKHNIKDFLFVEQKII